MKPIAHAVIRPARRWRGRPIKLYAIQFHPEVAHTPRGKALIRAFLYDVCGCEARWTADNFIEQAIGDIRARVGEHGRVLCGLSGGVDSSVVAALIHRAIGDRLVPVFVNNGLLREGEPETVQEVFGRTPGMPLVYADATGQFLEELAGVTDPEQKRKRIGETFVRVFEAHAAGAGPFEFLAQGTLYPGRDRERDAAIDARGAQDQDAPQRGRSARGYAVQADRAAAFPLQG
ncbi:MAG: hypothetical protein U0232_17010 [Thermomicrobiales bacterium]